MCEELKNLIIEDGVPEPMYLFFYKQEKLKNLVKEVARDIEKILTLNEKPSESSLLGLVGPGLVFATLVLKYLKYKNIQLSAINRVPIPHLRPTIDKSRTIIIIDDCVYTGYNLRRIDAYLKCIYKNTKRIYYPVFRIYNKQLKVGMDKKTEELIRNHYYCNFEITERKAKFKLRFNDKRLEELKCPRRIKGNLEEIKEKILSEGKIETWNLFQNIDLLEKTTSMVVDKLSQLNRTINCIVAASPWIYPIATLVAYYNDLPLILARKELAETEMRYRPRKILKKIEKKKVYPLIMDTIVYTGKTMELIINDFSKASDCVLFSIIGKKEKIRKNNKDYEILNLFKYEDILSAAKSGRR